MWDPKGLMFKYVWPQVFHNFNLFSQGLSPCLCWHFCKATMVQVAWSEIWNLDVDPQRQRHLLRSTGSPRPGACPGDRLPLAMTWRQFELFALPSKCRCPGGRLPASPRLCSGTHGRGEQSICGYYQHSQLIISSIIVKLTFTFSASSYWGSRCTSFIWQGCCLNWKKLNNTKQKILYCLIASAYKMFKAITLFHPSKCTKWRINSLCFFCRIAEEM